MATRKKKRKSTKATPAKTPKAKARTAGSKKSGKKRSRRPTASGSALAAEPQSDARHQFVALAMRIGTEEAQRLLDAIVDVQTPARRY